METPTVKNRIVKYATAAAISALVLFNTVSFLKAQDKAPEVGTCPTDKPCKVLTLSPEQVDAFDQLVTNTSIQGPYAQIKQVVDFYKNMLAKAPNGKPGKPEAAQEAPKK